MRAMRTVKAQLACVAAPQTFRRSCSSLGKLLSFVACAALLHAHDRIAACPSSMQSVCSQLRERQPRARDPDRRIGVRPADRARHQHGRPDAVVLLSRAERHRGRQVGRYAYHCSLSDVLLALLAPLLSPQLCVVSILGSERCRRGDCRYKFNIINLEKKSSAFNKGMRPVIHSMKHAQESKVSSASAIWRPNCALFCPADWLASRGAVRRHCLLPESPPARHDPERSVQ
jgi:hypothetical protein